MGDISAQIIYYLVQGDCIYREGHYRDTFPGEVHNPLVGDIFKTRQVHTTGAEQCKDNPHLEPLLQRRFHLGIRAVVEPKGQQAQDVLSVRV